MIQVVILIITMLTLSKNFRSGFASSPTTEMAIPVMMLKTTRPSYNDVSVEISF